MAPRYDPNGPALDLLRSVNRLRIATVADLIEDTGRKPSSVYGAVARLRQRGLLRRMSTRLHGDARAAMHLTLTSTSAALLRNEAG